MSAKTTTSKKEGLKSECGNDPQQTVSWERENYPDYKGERWGLNEGGDRPLRTDRPGFSFGEKL